MTIKLELCDGGLRIRLDRPERANALDRTTASELCRALGSIDPGAHRFVLLEGSGSVFCAGADLDEFPWIFAGYVRAVWHIWHFQRLIRAIRGVPVPVVAYADGVVVGGGCGLFWAADRALAGPRFRLRIGFARVGLRTDMGVTRFVPARATRRVFRLLLREDPWLDVSRACALGLADNASGVVVSEEDAIHAAGRLAEVGVRRGMLDRLAVDATLIWETLTQAWIGRAHRGRAPAVPVDEETKTEEQAPRGAETDQCEQRR